ncbi:MAG: AraC family transcriptional regulator [Lewinellaceae bacterium]|nr:AraC family transcriptional regulator [Saprospiraceae bacterium]MCB9340979.1 AraC family transcriptional regulator [Lewinellaceae bacterium]
MGSLSFQNNFAQINPSISEVAYELGFKYPQHFSRLFKQRTGLAPNEYRMQH